MKKNTRNILLFVLVLAVSFGVGVFLGKSGMKLPSVKLQLGAILWALLSLFLAFVLLINLHELGHLLFGKIAGYKLYMYQAGRLALRNENGKYRFEWGKSHKGLGGFCMMIPPEKGASKTQNLFFYAGGILTNLLTGATALLVIYLIGDMPTWLRVFLFLFGWISILVGVTNAIPMTTSGGIANDGKIIYSLFSNNAYARNLIRFMRVQQMVAAGIRPGQIEELQQPDGEEEMPDESGDFTSLWQLLRLFAAEDNQDPDNMRICAQRLEEKLWDISTLSRTPALYELCYTYSVLGEPEKAQTFYEWAAPDLEKDKDLNGNRVKAYYAFYVLNDKEQAQEYCRKALEVADKFPLKGQVVMEKEMIGRLLEGVK